MRFKNLFLFLILVIVILFAAGCAARQQKPENITALSAEKIVPNQNNQQTNTNAKDSNNSGDESNSDQSKIEYSPVSRPCMSTEFAKGFTENTDTDWSGKDSCGFDITYDQGGKFAKLTLDFPISSMSLGIGKLRPVNELPSSQPETCSTGKDLSDLDEGVRLGKVVSEQAMTLDGKSAYKVITEDSIEGSSYFFIAVYVCLGAKTYNWGNSPVNALEISSFTYSDDFQIETIDHALANWHWK